MYQKFKEQAVNLLLTQSAASASGKQIGNYLDNLTELANQRLIQGTEKIS